MIGKCSKCNCQEKGSQTAQKLLTASAKKLYTQQTTLSEFFIRRHPSSHNLYMIETWLLPQCRARSVHQF